MAHRTGVRQRGLCERVSEGGGADARSANKGSAGYWNAIQLVASAYVTRNPHVRRTIGNDILAIPF